jgi:molecular chaperone Hsp33
MLRTNRNIHYMTEKDILLSFTFKDSDVRATVIQLCEAWKEIAAFDRYSNTVARLLGEVTVATALMTSMIKFTGRLTTQIQGDGPLRLLVAECQSDLSLRATAKVDTSKDPINELNLSSLVNLHGRGRCAITIDPQDPAGSQPSYQGIVSLEGSSVADILQTYMSQSEQIETRFWLASNDKVATGLMLQKLPTARITQANVDVDTWNRATALASTLQDNEMLSFSATELVDRLFWQEHLERFPVRTPRFACTCSRQRISRMLFALGRSELDSILEEMREVQVECDFCARPYNFGLSDIEILFQTPTKPFESDTPRH